MKLTNQFALVTGASRGLGRAIAIALAAEGAGVAINYFPDPDGKERAGAEETARLCQHDGARTLLVAADVSKYEDCAKAVALVNEAFERLDILVNNAGILRDRTLRKMSVEEWNEVIAVHLNGTFHMCKAVIETMMGQNYGRIVNLSSVVAHMGNFGQTNYTAAKAGILGFTRSLAREVARQGITVNAVAPGFVDTDMTRSIPDQFRSKILESIPIGRAQTPEEIAHAVLFLASPEAASITGECLNVNGGWHMG